MRPRSTWRRPAVDLDTSDCDPLAQLGQPSDLARQFADELGTALARRAALVAVAGLALVAGFLAALRAFRLRGEGVVSRAEAVTIVRRASVGMGAGVVTMVGFGLTALALRHHTPSSWTSFALGLAGGGIIVLLATMPMVASAARLRPVAEGSAGDLNEDLGPAHATPTQRAAVEIRDRGRRCGRGGDRGSGRRTVRSL